MSFTGTRMFWRWPWFPFLIRNGEVPKAFVTAKPGCNPDAQSIIDFCKENLARFKAPKAVEFGELPKTATGKIKKFQLREKEWQGKERKVN
jgi:fatty-acyl-CoA synthase